MAISAFRLIKVSDVHCLILLGERVPWPFQGDGLGSVTHVDIYLGIWLDLGKISFYLLFGVLTMARMMGGPQVLTPPTQQLHVLASCNISSACPHVIVELVG